MNLATTATFAPLDCPCGARKALHMGHSEQCTLITRPSDAYHGHIITVPAHLIPAMYDDWRMDVIHEISEDGTRGVLTVNGYDMDDDGEISRIVWQTWNGTLATIHEDIAPDTTLTLWVPSIPDALAAELA